MSSGAPTSVQTGFEGLANYLEALEGNYRACLDHVDHELEIDGVEAVLRFHHPKFDANGVPKFESLATALVNHIISYCIESTKRPESFGPAEGARLFRQARDLFRKQDESGEAGELLLYFLLETVLKVPQVVCKMSLKTNRKEEVKGSDGIHIGYDSEADCMVLYLGEAKLYQEYGAALKDAFASIQALHDQDQTGYEISLVTSHYKHLSDEMQERVCQYLDTTDPIGEHKICHACLIGFDWTKYSALTTEKRTEFVVKFKDEYMKHYQKLRDKTGKIFETYAYRHMTFEIFFIPFVSVGDFRRAFKKMLLGGED
jgi:hypothetical protein